MSIGVIVTEARGVGRLVLDRPKAINALTHDMCLAMTEALLRWQSDPGIRLVTLEHAGERGFCAGGDIRMLAESGRGDGTAARRFFRDEYRLNHLLIAYDKPVVALMDGITMGGGVGIALPARYRVGTERTALAMPETGIGLFPDVGGGWHLPRLPGSAGLWIALTGAKLGVTDCLALGLVTHFCESQRLAELKVALFEKPEAAADLLDRYAGGPWSENLSKLHPVIDRHFEVARVEDIVRSLSSDRSEWAASQLRTIAAKSPTSLHVACRQLELGRAMTSFAENMRMEYRLACRLVAAPDFQEGVRAVIVDKDGRARWTPALLEQVDSDQIDALFAPLPFDEWTPLEEAFA